MMQLGATFLVSERLSITKSSATAPFSTPAVFVVGGMPLGRRTSRSGPFTFWKLKIALFAPLSLAATNWGLLFTLFGMNPVLQKVFVVPLAWGIVAQPTLLPPTVGCEWHWMQLSALNDGPRPLIKAVSSGVVVFAVDPLLSDPSTLAVVSKTRKASNQNGPRLPLLLTTLPAPSTGGFVPGCEGSEMSLQGVSGNFIEGVGQPVMVALMRGPGSTAGVVPAWAGSVLGRQTDANSATATRVMGGRTLLMQSIVFSPFHRVPWFGTW